MKINGKYMHMAVVHTAIAQSSIKDIADAVAKTLKDVEVHKVKSDGFTLRHEKGVDVSDSRLITAITDVVLGILNDNLEDATDYIMENYDFAYDPDRVSKSHMRDLFNFSNSGRLVYVEIDE